MKSTLLVICVTIAVSNGSTLRILAQNQFAGNANSFLDEVGAVLQTGDLVQLGYFVLSSSPAVGGVPFTDFVSIDNVVITLGSNGAFEQTIDLDQTIDITGTTDSTLQYGLRIFNNSSEANSTFFNTVTSDTWQFSFSDAIPPPLPSEVFIDPLLGDPTEVIWEGGATSAFQTTIANTAAIPEPSSSILLLGAGLLLGARRRK